MYVGFAVKAALTVPEVPDDATHRSLEVEPVRGLVMLHAKLLSTQTVAAEVVRVSVVAEAYLWPLKVGAVGEPPPDRLYEHVQAN